MSFDLSAEDADSVAQTLRRFVERAVAPRVERPEVTLSPRQLAELTGEAQELGLLNLDAEPGIGLWDAPDHAVARQLTLDCLRHLAHTSAGIALHFHQLALGSSLARRLGCCDGRATGYCLLGVYGMGRALLPRLLRGAALQPDEHTWLAAYFEPGPDCPRLVQIGTPTDAVLVARYDAELQSLWWQPVETQALIAERLSTAHGLNETDVGIVRELPADRPRPNADDPHGIATYAAALELDSLGLCAISVGAQRHSYGRASEYADLRVQGGTEIVNHPAVQLLLGQCRAALIAGEALLDGLARTALAPGSLERSLAARATLIEEGCRGANDALQVFGGSGYMRDNGLEKLVRDQNHLRVLRGSPGEQRRFVAELGRVA